MLIDALSGNLSFKEFIASALSALMIIFLTLPIHEFAHGFVAARLGDPTPKFSGRLSLNPFAHIDYMGALAILLFGFGWAKPVGVNPRYFKNPKAGMALTAFAGPVSNLMMAFLSYVIMNFVILLPLESVIVSFFFFFLYYFSLINVRLAVFNLIPIPPLDGFKVLSAVLPSRIYFRIMQYERYIALGLLLLLYSGVLSTPINFAVYYVDYGVHWLASLPFRLFI